MSETTQATDVGPRICDDCGHQHSDRGFGCVGAPTPSDLWAGVSPSACDCQPYRPRVSLTPGSITKVVTARRRYVCGNHLSGVEKHYVEVGDRHVSNSLPPNNSEIGNEYWWYLRLCLDCCPVEHDERRGRGNTPASSPADTTEAGR